MKKGRDFSDKYLAQRDEHVSVCCWMRSSSSDISSIGADFYRASLQPLQTRRGDGTPQVLRCRQQKLFGGVAVEIPALFHREKGAIVRRMCITLDWRGEGGWRRAEDYSA